MPKLPAGWRDVRPVAIVPATVKKAPPKLKPMEEETCVLPSASKEDDELSPIEHPYTPDRLLRWGKERSAAFIKANNLHEMGVQLLTHSHPVLVVSGACAYWRDHTCYICLSRCARLAAERGRNWNWPGCCTDRTPYGVIAHELGHHADWHQSKVMNLKLGAYYGGFSTLVRKESNEARLTSYCPNDAEWFAEMFRLFITNHALLYEVRPKTWNILAGFFNPVSDIDWERALGKGCPDRVLKSQLKR